MNAKVIIGFILATFVIIVGLAWYAQPKTQAGGGVQHPAGNTSTAPSSLTSDSMLFDFGTISMAEGKVTHQFKIANSSTFPVSLNKIYTSCMCTATQFTINAKTYGPFGMEGMGGNTSVDVTMGPGETAVVDAIYDPAAHGPAGVGNIDRYISLQDTNGGTLQLEIKALVTP